LTGMKKYLNFVQDLQKDEIETCYHLTSLQIDSTNP
jgi:hypothetical protein